MKGFMCLLKKGVPLCWDEETQRSFDALKHALMYAPLLRPPDYGKDFLLYVAIGDSKIDMVLVQEDDVLEEHVIYYLSRGLVGLDLNYSHLEKLALVVVHIFQWFGHYILLHKTIVVVIVKQLEDNLDCRLRITS
jgi:hypothetical protein